MVAAKSLGVLRRLAGPPANQPLHLTRRHYGFSEFNVSPAAAQVNGIVRRLGFSMFAFVTTWIQYRRQKRAAIEAAVRHFDATTGRKALPRISSVIGELNGDLVVRVCHGQQ